MTLVASDQLCLYWFAGRIFFNWTGLNCGKSAPFLEWIYSYVWLIFVFWRFSSFWFTNWAKSANNNLKYFVPYLSLLLKYHFSTMCYRCLHRQLGSNHFLTPAIAPVLHLCSCEWTRKSGPLLASPTNCCSILTAVYSHAFEECLLCQMRPFYS